MKQLSLLDLKPEKGPSAKLELDWHLYGRHRFEMEKRRFKELYASTPIFWKQVKKRFDLFLTHPRQVLIVDRKTGKLVDGDGFERDAWDSWPANFSAQRMDHLSPQLQKLLQGEMPAGNWSPEVMEDIRYVPEQRTSIFELLSEHRVDAYVDMGPYRGIFRVFAPPETLEALYLQGAGQGVFL